MGLEFYRGWAQDPNAAPTVVGASSGTQFQVAHRLSFPGGHTSVSVFSASGYRFPMTVTVPEYLGSFEDYQILISNDQGANWRLAYSGKSRTQVFAGFNSNWVIVNPGRVISAGVSLLDFGTFSSTVSPSIDIFARATSPSSEAAVFASRRNGEAVPELYGKLLVEFVGRYAGVVGNGAADLTGANSSTYNHPYLSSNRVTAKLATNEIAIFRLSLVSFDPSTPIDSEDQIRIKLDAGITSYPLPVAPRQASKAILYDGFPNYTSSGLLLEVSGFKLARFGAVVSSPKQTITLPSNASTAVYVARSGEITLSLTQFQLGIWSTSSSGVNSFTPNMAWLPDETRIGTAGSALQFGDLLTSNFTPSSSGNYVGVALHSAGSGARIEYAARGVAWIRVSGPISPGSSVFSTSGGQAASSGSTRIGYALSGNISGYAVVQLEASGVSGVGGGGANLAVGNGTATTLDITSDSGTDATIPSATDTQAGLLSAANKVKLDSLPGIAQSNLYQKTQSVAPVVVTDGPSVAIQGDSSNTLLWTIGANRTVPNVTSPINGAVYNFHITQGSGGPYALSWGSQYKGTIDAIKTTGTTWFVFQCIGSDLRFAGSTGPF